MRKKWRCEQCDETFINETNFTNHINYDIHRNKDGKFACPLCPAVLEKRIYVSKVSCYHLLYYQFTNLIFYSNIFYNPKFLQIYALLLLQHHMKTHLIGRTKSNRIRIMSCPNTNRGAEFEIESNLILDLKQSTFCKICLGCYPKKDKVINKSFLKMYFKILLL